MDLLKKAYRQTEAKSGKDLAPVLMALITSANQRGIRFSSSEISLILQLLKEGKSEKEIAQMDQTVQLVNSFMSKRK